MKAIILAAWIGNRLKPVTDILPKPLIKVFWKSIMEYNIEHIHNYVSEIIIIVKYKKELIIKDFWDNYKNTPITYIEQGEKKWTAAAIEWINTSETILLLNGDSIFFENDLQKIIMHEWYGCLVKEVENPFKYWIFKQNSEWYATSIIEKPSEFVGNLANVWVYKFSSEIIKLSRNVPLSARWEYEITDAINEFLKKEKFSLLKNEHDFLDIWTPEDLFNINMSILNSQTKSIIEWTIEAWVYIEWNVILKPGSVIKKWTIIKWNLYVWENTIIEWELFFNWNNVIWKNCHIKDDLIDSLILDDVDDFKNKVSLSIWDSQGFIYY